MTVCKFWKAGTCKFGDQCRFEHPPGMAGTQPLQKQDAFMRPPPEQDQNRFGQQNRNNQNQNQNFNNNNQRYSNQQQSRGFRDYKGNRSGRDPQPYGVTREVLQEDLHERPNWIMSCYGPGKDPDIQLFGGYPLEHSPEEVRLLHYQAMASGNPQQSAQVEAELAQISNEQVEAVTKDLSGALHYLANGSKEHPNRTDICKAGTSNNIKRNGDGPFSKSTRHREISEQRRALANNNTGFGQRQSNVGFASQQQQQQQPQGFGSAPQNPPANQAFGAQGVNTGFASQNQPAFGQQPQQSQFGAPQNTGFNTQPPAAGFGQPDQPMASPQMAQGNTHFGMNNNNGSNFAQIQPPQPAQVNNAFGQPQQLQQPSPFSNPPQQQQATPSPFGASPMNQQQAQPPFGSGFGQQQQQQQPPQGVINGFGQQQQPPQQPNGPGGNPNGDVNSYSTRDATNKLLTWKGRPVNYVTADEPCFQQDDRSWERIWFPDGEPQGAENNANQAGGFSAVDLYSTDAKEAFGFLKDNGKFKDGVVPEIAPVSSLVRWDV